MARRVWRVGPRETEVWQDGWCEGGLGQQGSDQSINQYKFYSERNITENIKIFLQLYMIMLIC